MASVLVVRTTGVQVVRATNDVDPRIVRDTVPLTVGSIVGIGSAATHAATDFDAAGAAAAAQSAAISVAAADATSKASAAQAAAIAASDTAGAAAAAQAASLQKSSNLSDLAAASTARTNLGLGNVDNTSDANKPISSATQTALNAKAPLASPTFTGTPAAPTPATGDASTTLATTAFVSRDFVAQGAIEFNARTYGAKGDGVTDDTTALQNCLTAAGNANGVAVIPAGTYLVSSQLNLPNGASLRMYGATLRASATISGALIVVGALSLRWRDKFILGGYLDCNNNSDHAIEVLSGYNSLIDAVTWMNPKMHGVILGNTGATKGTEEMRVARCKGDKTLDAAVVTGSVGIWIKSNCNDATIIDNIVVGAETSFQTDGSANTHIGGHGYGISVSAQFPQTVFKDTGSENVYIGCYADTPSLYGFWFTSASFRWTVIGARCYNGSIGLDNVATAIHIDQVGSDPNSGTILGVHVVSVNSSHRWAADYDGYIGSTKLMVHGCVVSNVVTPSLSISNLQTLNSSQVRMVGTAPTIANGAAVGTSPPTATVDSHSRNQGGQVKLGTGTSPTTGALCTVTFSANFQTTPFVTVTPNNAATAALGLYISAVNTSGFTLSCQTAPSASLAAASLLASYAVSVGV